jgi:phosphoserine phosphatase
LATLPFANKSSSTDTDPLPSWQDTEPKSVIREFVQRTTNPDSPDFVPPSDRIAAFDNDGTLWVEKPLPNEVYFTLSRVREFAARDPALAQRQPYKAALQGDAAYFHAAGPRAVLELVVATHAGLPQEELLTQARSFLTSRHPKLGRPFASLTYQPMLELLTYLRVTGYETWICSGGDTDFMRAFAAQLYGIPSERVIGSQLKRETRRTNDRLTVWRLPQIETINDKEGKAVGIDGRIGKRPVLVAGNVLSGGDIAMMEYSKGRSGPSLQLLINHDDREREFFYTEKDGASVEAARIHDFKVVSMRTDWKRIFDTGPASPGHTTLGEYLPGS